MRPVPFASAAFAVLLATAAIGPAPVAQAAEVYRLTASNVMITLPAPLFSSSTITGTITLADTVAPGMSFGFPSVLGAALNFGGVTGTLADIQADIAPGPVQIFGTRSADGLSLSMLDFRFGFPTTNPGCGFVCAGQIILNSGFDPSNFIAINDLAGDTLSVIDSFTPSLILVGVPAPAGGLFFCAGVLAVLAARRRGFAV